MTETYDVIIAGGGPVGAALAVNLGLRGITCALIERHEEPQRIPKGQNLLQRSVEHFWFWGLESELRDARVMSRDFPMSGVVAYGSLETDWWYAPPLRELLNKYFLLENERLPQYQLESVLRRKLLKLETVETLFGWTVDGVSQDAGSVTFEISDAKKNSRRTVQGRFAVGCDGSHSLVREKVGITRGGDDFDQPMVLAVFRSAELSQKLAERYPKRSTYRVMDPDLKGYWKFFGRVDEDESWFFHSPVPVGTTRESFDFAKLLHDAAGFEFGVEFDHVGFWDLRISVANRYRVDRVFIAGDAAHSHPPYGGYGLNNGLEDAVNLGWKLEARLKGWGNDNLLDSYTAERQPVFVETGRDFIAGLIESDRKFFEIYDPKRDRAAFEKAWKEEHAGSVAHRVLGYEPNYEGSPVVDGPPSGVCSAHGSYSFEARTGHHLPPQLLSSGRNVYEDLGQGFTLLAFDTSDAEVSVIETAAKMAGMPMKTVLDSYADGRAEYGRKMILVRPDQFVAWCGDAPLEDPAALIRKITGN